MEGERGGSWRQPELSEFTLTVFCPGGSLDPCPPGSWSLGSGTCSMPETRLWLGELLPAECGGVWRSGPHLCTWPNIPWTLQQAGSKACILKENARECFSSLSRPPHSGWGGVTEGGRAGGQVGKKWAWSGHFHFPICCMWAPQHHTSVIPAHLQSGNSTNLRRLPSSPSAGDCFLWSQSFLQEKVFVTLLSYAPFSHPCSRQRLAGNSQEIWGVLERTSK